MRTFVGILLLIAASTGCAVRTYEGTDAKGQPVKLRSVTFLSWGQMNRLSVGPSGLKVGSISEGTEVEKIAPLVGAIAEGVVKGMKP